MEAGPYSERVHRVMDHVRKNLAETLSLERLAKVAHFSPYHFHRIFRAATGETLAQFTRRARLERAVYLMKAAPSRQLGSIALEVGFASQGEFSRAFRKRYGVAPRAWDRKSALHTDSLYDRDAPPGPDESSEPPTVVTAQYAACRIAYVRVTAPFITDALPVGYERLRKGLAARGIDWTQCALIGMSWDNYETTPLPRVHYDLGFVVPPSVVWSREDADDGLGLMELPAMRCANARVTGALIRIARAWDHLYDVWLPQSQFEPDFLPAMKRFARRPEELPDNAGWSQWDVDCSIPVRTRLG